MINDREILISKQDPSVNFAERALEGFLEARYVRKIEDYFICYLSSANGCNLGCRFCWLTSTKQTRTTYCTTEEYLEQARQVLEHYIGQAPAKYMHFNFMARGEILANPHFLENADEILFRLGKLVHEYDPSLAVKFNVSTIMPKALKPLSLANVFKIVQPTIYYSLYHWDQDFKRKWMPQAMPTVEAIEMLAEYQEISKKKIKIHHCLIKDENDHPEDVKIWAEELHRQNILWDFNLVRYNPYSEKEGVETDDAGIDEYLHEVRAWCPGEVKVIPRIGTDVLASCGMFIQ